jgi:H+-translocating NAD(P) transhydrogenase subunit alpha
MLLLSETPTAAPLPQIILFLMILLLATFLGLGIIRRVSPLLHTPLMSLTNAISAIAVVGAIIIAGGEHYSTTIRVMGAIAVFASMTNIISGFLITQRMLKMFKERAKPNNTSSSGGPKP